jgi:hypothetical protein
VAVSDVSLAARFEAFPGCTYAASPNNVYPVPTSAIAGALIKAITAAPAKILIIRIWQSSCETLISPEEYQLAKLSVAVVGSYAQHGFCFVSGHGASLARWASE